MATTTRKTKQQSQSKYTRRRKLLFAAAFALCLYFVVSIASTQIENYKQRKTLQDLDEQIKNQQLENDELLRLASGETTEDYIERIAREKLGYAASDERIFVDEPGSKTENNEQVAGE